MTPSGHGESAVPLGEVTLGEGATVEVELRDGGAGRVRGQVLRGGRPLKGARVLLRPPGFDWLAGYAWATTDALGRFAAEVPPGRVVASTAGADERAAEVAPGAAVDVALEVRAGTVAGRVLGRDGQPVVGVRLLPCRLDEPGAQADLPGAQAPEGRTDALGRFELDRVPPGRYRPVASGHGQGTALGDDLALGAHDARTGLDLRLGPGARLEVTLRRSDGARPPGPGSGCTMSAWPCPTTSSGATGSRTVGAWSWSRTRCRASTWSRAPPMRRGWRSSTACARTWARPRRCCSRCARRARSWSPPRQAPAWRSRSRAAPRRRRWPSGRWWSARQASSRSVACLPDTASPCAA